MSISLNRKIKCENGANKTVRRRNRDKTAKIKMQPNKINLMIETIRQKNSAPIAKRVSGDGAFCLFNSFIGGGIYFAGCALIGGAKRRHLYIYKGTPCAHLFKKAVFCRVLSCLIV